MKPPAKARPKPTLTRVLPAAGLLLVLLVWTRRPHQHGAGGEAAGAAELGRAGGGSGGARRAAAELAADADAAEVVRAVTAGAAAHGFVTKAGPADLRNWHPDHKADRAARVEEWLALRERHLADGHLPPPLPVFMGCQVYVNHLYKVLFLRHAKTASSSLFCHFGGCRAANASAEDEAARKALSFELFQAKSVAELERLWVEYFVVTFVRNPYQRAVSSYKMMMRQLALGGELAERYSWGRFCEDPAGFADECAQDAQCKVRPRNFVYVHIQPQHPCIVTADGGWAVDFIGRVESIDEDLGLVLQELEKRRPADAPAVKPLEGSLANVNGRGCNESAAEAGHAVAPEQYCEPEAYYRGQHAACYDRIQHHYHDDAFRLGFSSPGEAAAEGQAAAGQAAGERGAAAVAMRRSRR